MKLASAFLVCATVLLVAPVAGSSVPPEYHEIARLEQARSVAPSLLEDLGKEPAVAARAALAAGRTKRPVVLNTLRGYLVTPDPAVRAMVAYALGLQTDVRSLARLVRLAGHDQNSAVRYAAVDATGRILAAEAAPGTQTVAERLLAVMRDDGDPTVRGHAAANLDVFRDAPFSGTVVAAVEHAIDREHDSAVRWHEAWLLFRAFAQRADAGFLKRIVHDPEELVRVEALRAWGRRTDPGAAAVVRPLLNDPSWRVQLEAREALRRLAGLDPTAHLTTLPPGIHVPPLPPAAGASLAQRPPASPRQRAPSYADVPDAPPLLPTSVALMNGPLPGPHPRVAIHTTKGDVVLRLYPEWAPFTVASFLGLVKRGYYDHNRFFRIVPDFVVQTGDPNDDKGRGDAGYHVKAEENPIEQRTGVVAMGLNYDKTNHAVRDSAGTEFYITLSPQLHLDRDFTVFGEVESGFDVLPNLIESDRMLRLDRIRDD